MLDLAQPWELLAEETLVPVVFNTGATGLGKALNPGGSRQDIEPGDDLELPLWLVAPLQVRGAVYCKLPDVYRERYRQKLNAGAETVSFKNKAPYFYEVGIKLNQFLKDIELSDFLTRTFRTRYQALVAQGLNMMTGEQVLQLSSKLSHEEQQLFDGGRLSMMRFDNWLRNVSPLMESQGGAGKRPHRLGAGAAEQASKRQR